MKYFPENTYRNIKQSFDQFVNSPISHDMDAIQGWRKPPDFKEHEMPEVAFTRTIEQKCPPCMSSVRRVSGILLGVGLLTMRVLSLADQWHEICEKVLTDEFGDPPPPKKEKKPPAEPGQEHKEEPSA